MSQFVGYNGIKLEFYGLLWRLVMELNATIGKRIAKLRREHNMTQEQLSEKLDISIKHCSSVERGLSSLSLEKLVDVSELFDVSIDYLVKGTLNPNEDNISQFLSEVPQSIVSIMSSDDENLRNLLLEYLKFFSKIHQNSYI